MFSKLITSKHLTSHLVASKLGLNNYFTIMKLIKLSTYLRSLGYGAHKDFAKKIGVSKSHLSQMIAGTSNISNKRCYEIEVLTGGVVDRKYLRPHDWKTEWPELAQKQNKEVA